MHAYVQEELWLALVLASKRLSESLYDGDYKDWAADLQAAASDVLEGTYWDLLHQEKRAAGDDARIEALSLALQELGQHDAYNCPRTFLEWCEQVRAGA